MPDIIVVIEQQLKLAARHICKVYALPAVKAQGLESRCIQLIVLVNYQQQPGHIQGETPPKEVIVFVQEAGGAGPGLFRPGSQGNALAKGSGFAACRDKDVELEIAAEGDAVQQSRVKGLQVSDIFPGQIVDVDSGFMFLGQREDNRFRLEFLACLGFAGRVQHIHVNAAFINRNWVIG